MKRLLLTLACVLSLSIAHAQQDRGFIHPGGLHTQADFDRVKQQLAEGNTKVTQAYNVLKSAAYAQSSAGTNPVETIVRGGGNGENYLHAARGAAIAYQNALRWKIEGNKACAKHAVDVLMKWCNTTKVVTGNSDARLAFGLYGYEFAQAAELMRDYKGWKREDFAKFQRWMLDLWYPGCINFLRDRNGTWENSGKWWQAPGHYWSNWGLCNALAVISIGVLCDDVFIYNQGMSFIKYDQCGTFKDPRTANPILNDGLTEFWGNLIVTTTAWEKETGAYGKVGQMNESGRDTGHASMALGLAVDIAHRGWNQGDDLFSHMDHRLAAGIEYVAAQTQSIADLPWTNYHYGSSGYYYSDSRAWLMTEPALGTQMRPYWGTVIGHYCGIKGVKMPFSEKAYKDMGIDAGGQGATSGGYDHLGYSVLMNTYSHGDNGIYNPNPPTELQPTLSYGGKTYKQNDLGGLTNTFETTTVNKRALAAGTVVTLSPKLPEGEEDTGKWLWSTGETTREITVTADSSYIYRVSYTNASGAQSQLCFPIAVLGDCHDSNVIQSYTYSGKTSSDSIIVVKSGASVTLKLDCNEGWGNYLWDNGKTTQSITVSSIKKNQTISGCFQNQGGHKTWRTFHIYVNDLEADASRLVENGSYRLRSIEDDTYLTNNDGTVSFLPLDESKPATQLWYIEHTGTTAKYSFMSYADSLYIKKDGTMSRVKLRSFTATYAQDSEHLIIGNTDQYYWWINDSNETTFTSLTQLYGFPFELIPTDYDTSIAAPLSPQSSTEAYYTLGGTRIASPKRGITIVRTSDGKAKKIFTR